MAVAEQVAGIIVGCMPVMPSFFRHFFGQSRRHTPYNSNQKNWKLRYANFSIGGGGNNRHGAAKKDPYLVATTLNNTIYEELDDIEAVKAPGPKNEARVISGADRFDPTLENERGLQTIPINSALVSKSFQVESHPL